MFDTMKVASKIRQLRIQSNLTQMNLADSMGVSVQAVSNWERGNSMPDISKLGELAVLFGCTVDEILGESRKTQVVAQFLENRGDREPDSFEIEDLEEVAPLLKPDQIERMLKACLKQEKSVSMDDVTALAPFLSEAFLEELMESAQGGEDFDSLVGLMPFLSREYMEKRAEKLLETGAPGMEQLTAMAPFLSSDFLNRAIEKMDAEVEFDEIMGLLPFVSRDTLEELAKKALEKGEPGLEEIVGLAPFLSRDFLKSLVKSYLDTGGDEDGSEIAGLAPFLDQETLAQVAEIMMKKGHFSGLVAIAPFLRNRR